MTDSTISGTGLCTIDGPSDNMIPLELSLNGQVSGDEASGKIMVTNQTNSTQVNWTGRFYTSGNNITLRGEFSGELYIDAFDQKHPYVGSFELD